MFVAGNGFLPILRESSEIFREILNKAYKKGGNDRIVQVLLLPPFFVSVCVGFCHFIFPKAKHGAGRRPVLPKCLLGIMCFVGFYAFTLNLLAPVFLALANVGLVAELGHLLSLREHLVCLLRECLLY